MVAPPPIQLSSIGMADSIILMILALVVFGPRRLPQIGRQIGKLMYEFRKASNDFKFQMEEELRLAEDADRRKKEEEERQRKLALTPPTEPGALPASQTIEAKAAIGADEQASVSAPPPTEPESEYPAPNLPETAAAAEQHAPYPRINPPSTGEQVQRQGPEARDQGSDSSEQGAASAESAETGAAANSSIGAATGVSGDGIQPERSASAHEGASSETARTEAVSHHG